MSNNLINIKIPKYNLNYQIDNKKNIIESSLDKNIKLAHSCKSGICGTCKAKIISGELNKNNKINHILSESELARASSGSAHTWHCTSPHSVRTEPAQSPQRTSQR